MAPRWLIPLSGGDHGLAYSEGSVVADLEHAGRRCSLQSIPRIDCLTLQLCIEALNEAIYWFGPPDIMNSDQGSQFTSFAWTDRLRRSGIRISMDGKGRYLDNIFIERLWRKLKYECVYLRAWETGSQARAGVRKWMEFDNHSRPHKALGGQPPAVVYSLHIETTQPDQQEQIRA